MIKSYLVLVFLSLSFQSIASDGKDVAGFWEGFYSGSHVHQGKMTININADACSVTMQQLEKSEKLVFPCANISQSGGVYTFTAKQKFTSGAGQIEWRFSFALGVGHENPKVARKLVGTWLQGMRKDGVEQITGLNSGLMKLKQIKGQ